MSTVCRATLVPHQTITLGPGMNFCTCPFYEDCAQQDELLFNLQRPANSLLPAAMTLPDAAVRINRYLRSLAPHVADREAAQLLHFALYGLNKYAQALKDLKEANETIHMLDGDR